jgi:hypothetical protein
MAAGPNQYTDLSYVRRVGLMPKSDVDLLEQREGSGFVDGVCEAVSRYFDTILVKRYATPQPQPIPESLKWHSTSVVVRRLYGRRGWAPGAGPDDEVIKAAEAAEAWLAAAVDSEKGNAELVRTTGQSVVEKGGPYGYSEAGPYEWIDVQREAVRGRR